MRTFRSWIYPAVPWLVRHVERLRESLDLLIDRLREAVARAVGDNVATAIHEAIQILLSDGLGHPVVSYRPAARSAPSPLVWDDPERSIWGDDEEDEEEQEEESRRTSTHARPLAPRWPQALVVGLHTAAWWLRRRVGRRPLLTALGAGLATALATFLGGPFAATAVGLAGSALSLLSLAETIQTGAKTLGPRP